MSTFSEIRILDSLLPVWTSKQCCNIGIWTSDLFFWQKIYIITNKSIHLITSKIFAWHIVTL